MLKNSVFTIISLFILLGFNLPAMAYEIVVLPEQMASEHDKQLHYEALISKSLSRQLHQVHSNQSSALCDDACDYTDARLYEKTLERFPGADFLVFYFVEENTLSRLSAFDTLSQIQLASVELLASSQPQHSASQMLIDTADLLAIEIKQRALMNTIELALSGFSVEELVPITGFLLSLSENNQIKLIETRQQDYLFANFFPIVNSSYALTTDVPIAHLSQEINRFWDLQDTLVKISFERSAGVLEVSRIGKPYTPSIVIISLFTLIFCLLSAFLFKRYRINQQLEYLSNKKRADSWIALFEASNKPWFQLNSQWRNQHNYWQQIKRESESLEKQAKVFYDAGDLRTSKLFISKSLNVNADAPLARSLMNLLIESEENQKDLNQDEQWISNRIAKSMSNFRNRKVYKALRQAYEAEQRAMQKKANKKQLKAIRKLLSKILFQQAIKLDRLTLKLTDALEQLSVGNESVLLIGREDNWLNQSNTGIMCLNHKGLSRLGKQVNISFLNNAYHVQELGSTNGSYLNQQALRCGESVLLQDKDSLVLGDPQERFGVPIAINISNDLSLCELRCSVEVSEQNHIHELAKVWPDYIHAIRHTYLISQKNLIIAYDKKEHRLQAMNEQANTKQLKALFTLQLNPFLALEPLNEDVMINGEPLLGKTPIILPLEVQFSGKSIMISADEFAYQQEYKSSQQFFVESRSHA